MNEGDEEEEDDDDVLGVRRRRWQPLSPEANEQLRIAVEGLDNALDEAVNAYRAVYTPKWKALVRVLTDVGIPWR